MVHSTGEALDQLNLYFADMTDRRPIPSRQSGWARRVAKALADAGISPNAISIVSTVIAGLGAACLVASRDADTALRTGLLLAAAASIPTRLLCNLFDGMVAVEHLKGSKAGEVFNELPDRISDALLLVSAGYAVARFGWASDLGWAAAFLAVMTAYIRTLGSSLGVGADFSGPLAKQQRMILLAIACILATFEVLVDATDIAITSALVVITAGTALTALLRAGRLIHRLEAR